MPGTLGRGSTVGGCGKAARRARAGSPWLEPPDLIAGSSRRAHCPQLPPFRSQPGPPMPQCTWAPADGRGGGCRRCAITSSLLRPEGAAPVAVRSCLSAPESLAQALRLPTGPSARRRPASPALLGPPRLARFARPRHAAMPSTRTQHVPGPQGSRAVVRAPGQQDVPFPVGAVLSSGLPVSGVGAPQPPCASTAQQGPPAMRPSHYPDAARPRERGRKPPSSARATGPYAFAPPLRYPRVPNAAAKRRTRRAGPAGPLSCRSAARVPLSAAPLGLFGAGCSSEGRRLATLSQNALA
jgi:hypothetical protein